MTLWYLSKNKIIYQQISFIEEQIKTASEKHRQISKFSSDVSSLQESLDNADNLLPNEKGIKEILSKLNSFNEMIQTDPILFKYMMNKKLN